MAAQSIDAAFASYPEGGVAACTAALTDFTSNSPPGSPVLSSRCRTRKSGRKTTPWPMPRAQFVLDEKRVPKGRKKEYTIDSFIDEYGPDDGSARWAEAEPFNTKAEEGELRHLVALLRNALLQVKEGEPAVLSVVEKLIVNLPSRVTTDPATGNKTSVLPRPAAAACLIPLVQKCRSQIDPVMAQLKECLRAGETQVIRRCAALGFASVLKGLGIGSIKAYGVMEFLAGLLGDKKNASGRQSAIFVYEALFRLFGYPFEPYVLKCAPLLLNCFDDNSNVRDAAERCAVLFFGNLSPFATVRLLPELLKATMAKSWRTKGSAAMCLGAMAGCAPRALSSSLPQIVPRLADMQADSNPQVTARAGESLKLIASVITNPEIVLVTPKLLAGLCSPGSETRAAIQSLMSTSYVHPIDPASLALLMPILNWGLKDRSADTKRAAVQVVGSACNLVKQDRDLLPYFHDLLPELMNLVLDSIPDTRLFASKAIGMLLRRFGEKEAPELIAWLLKKMEEGNNQIERQGAAQCLAEVLYALGIARFEVLLPTLRERLSSSDAKVREGFTSFLLHLPVKFNEQLEPYVPELLTHVLQAMNDGGHPVRTVAKEAGVQLVQVYYLKMEELVLPKLEEALLENKTKVAAVRLLGYLMARMANVYDLQLDPDEMQASDAAVNKVTAHDGLKIIELIGKPKRDYLLAKLNLYKFDADQEVRDMCGRVLRSLCENLKKDQADILPELLRSPALTLTLTLLSAPTLNPDPNLTRTL